MNFKKNGGFTLVELIVVIAILGILAGIGIPQYSQYVEKAQIAVDEQNIVMLHNAFVVACVGNNVDPAAVTAVKADWRNGNEFHGLLSVTRSGTDPVVEDFNGFVSEPIIFKKLGEGVVEAGIVKGLEAVTYTKSLGNGGSIVLNQGAIDALKNSTYYSVGAEGLLNQINTVTGIAGEMAGDGPLGKVFTSADFVASAAVNMGLDPKDPQIQEKLQAKMTELAAQSLNMTADQYAALGQDEKNAAEQKIMANAAVLYTAKNTSNMTTAEALSLVSSATTQSIIDNMNNKSGTGTEATGLNQAALVYGMVYAYAQTDEGKSANNGAGIDCTSANDVLYVLEHDPNFDNYLTNQGTKDMEAYLGALGMINSSASEGNAAVDHIMINGFNSEDLTGIFTEALGK